MQESRLQTVDGSDVITDCLHGQIQRGGIIIIKETIVMEEAAFRGNAAAQVENRIAKAIAYSAP